MQWLLPEGVEEVLSPAAWDLEALRRRLLDECRRWGYDLILPPLIEHADALLSGVGAELDLQSFRLTDQLSGRQLAVRADITPQAARIDARHFADGGVARLCYFGTVIRTRPDQPGGPRCYRQLGAELFGHNGVASDGEILNLMLRLLDCCGINDLHLDLGHVGVYRALIEDLSLDEAQTAAVFDLLQLKAAGDLAEYCDSLALSPPDRADLAALCELFGGDEVLARAQAQYAARPAVMAALDELAAVLAQLRAQHPELPVHLDLAELRGFSYQTGVVFAAFVPGMGRELARGGRYDGVGTQFGADRPAIGFSADLNALAERGAYQAPAQARLIAPHHPDDAALQALIDELRGQGKTVVVDLSGRERPDLILQDGRWQPR